MGAGEAHELELCAGSSEVKMSVPGGGVYLAPGDEREG